MPIATITPQSNAQSNLLANALNGTSGSLAQALNAAIQRSSQDVQVQLQQGQTFVAEQARNIKNEQQERFDLRNRAENAIRLNQTAENSDVINTGRTIDQANTIRNQDYINDQRNILKDNQSTPAEVNSFGFEAKKQTHQFKNEDRQRLIEGGGDKVTQIIQDNDYQQNQKNKLIASDATPADVTASKQEAFVTDQNRNNIEYERSETKRVQTDGQATQLVNNNIEDIYQDISKVEHNVLMSDLKIIEDSTISGTEDAIRRTGVIRDELINRGMKEDGGNLLPDKPISAEQRVKLNKANADIPRLELAIRKAEKEDFLDEELIASLTQQLSDAKATKDGFDPQGSSPVAKVPASTLFD